jgi:hypothetical protein
MCPLRALTTTANADLSTWIFNIPFLHIVMKVALFTGKNVVKVVLFCIHLLGNDCQSIPIFLL